VVVVDDLVGKKCAPHHRDFDSDILLGLRTIYCSSYSTSGAQRIRTLKLCFRNNKKSVYTFLISILRIHFGLHLGIGPFY
jgi:hypothetical protein